MFFNKLYNSLLVEMAVEMDDVILFSSIVDPLRKNTIRPKHKVNKGSHKYVSFRNTSMITSPGYVKMLVHRLGSKLPFKFKIYVNDLFDAEGFETNHYYRQQSNNIKLYPTDGYISLVVDSGFADPMTPFMIGHRLGHTCVPWYCVVPAFASWVEQNVDAFVGANVQDPNNNIHTISQQDVDEFLQAVEQNDVGVYFDWHPVVNVMDIKSVPSADTMELFRNKIGQYCTLGTVVLRRPKTQQRIAQLEQAFNDCYHQQLQKLVGCNPIGLMTEAVFMPEYTRGNVYYNV